MYMTALVNLFGMSCQEKIPSWNEISMEYFLSLDDHNAYKYVVQYVTVPKITSTQIAAGGIWYADFSDHSNHTNIEEI